jgi:hypothetical protein
MMMVKAKFHAGRHEICMKGILMTNHDSMVEGKKADSSISHAVLKYPSFPAQTV